jgi:hypothetical protein
MYYTESIEIVENQPKIALIKAFLTEALKVVVIVAAIYIIFPIKDETIIDNTKLNTAMQELNLTKQKLVVIQNELKETQIRETNLKEELAIQTVITHRLQLKLEKAIIPESSWKEVWRKHVG